MESIANKKVCIIHDWLTTYAGAERVLEQVLNIFPDSDIFSIVDFIDKNERDWLKNKQVKTSFIQKLPFAQKKYRSYLPLMPLAIEQFDLSKYDIVISLSHAVAKGVLTGPNQLHVCLCFSPIRYAWDLQHQYLRESNLKTGIKSVLARWILHKIRIWDVRTSNGVDDFIAISNFISRRIKKVYNRSSKVIYPPVDTNKFKLINSPKENYYVTCSRMVPYKRIDLIVETFSKEFPEKKLVVIGDGPEHKKIKKIAGKNIEFLGKVPFKILHKKLALAKAFIFAAEEDFGIAPIEAQSCGTPVIAYRAGAASETINGNDSFKKTGIFFNSQTIESLSQAVRDFECSDINFAPEVCRENSLRFSKENFIEEFNSFVHNSFKKKMESL